MNIRALHYLYNLTRANVDDGRGGPGESVDALQRVVHSRLGVDLSFDEVARILWRMHYDGWIYLQHWTRFGFMPGLGPNLFDFRLLNAKPSRV